MNLRLGVKKMGDNNFSLIQQLDDIAKTPDSAKSPLPNGIAYESFTLFVDNQETEVFIPLRESKAFQQTLVESSKHMSRSRLADLLREHRGIKRHWE